MYALFSFFSAPYLGSLSDRVGRRPILILSIFSSAVGWLIFAQAKTLLWLYVGRIIDGLAAGNITAAQSTLADIAKDDNERTKNMGLFGALFGLGFIIGPALGGLLSVFGIAVPFYAVGCLALINGILAYFFLPETHKEKHADKKVSLNPLAPIIAGFKNREMREIFFIWLLFGIALSTQQGVFALYTQNVLGMSAQTTAWIFAGVGILIVINQFVLVPKLWLKHFSRKNLTYLMLIMFGLGIIFQSVPVIAVFIASLFLTTFGQGNLRMLFGSFISNANPAKRGEYLGISSSIMSLAMIIGPLIATITYIRHPGGPFIIAGLLSLACYIIMKRFPMAMVH